MPARKGHRVPVTDEKRSQWNKRKKQAGLTARAVCDRVVEIEPDKPRPTEQTIRAILTGRTRATPLAETLDKIFAECEPKPSPAQSVTQGALEGALVNAYRLAVQTGGDPKGLVDAAVDAMAKAVEAQLRAQLRALLPRE